MNPETAQILIESIESRRLVLFAGAGISMAPPSQVPSARQLAESCAKGHQDRTGENLALDPNNPLGRLAEHFLARGTLETYFAEQLVEWRPFHWQPNSAHVAIADFLACEALEFGATTNLDTLIEVAARELGDVEFAAATNVTMANAHRDHSTLVKLHGCARERRVILWCEGQLETALWRERVEEWVTWLSGRLIDRDIVFAGYWTDWDYLIKVLDRCLGGEVPRHVFLIDPSPEEELRTKAPDLWNWSHRTGIRFRHERMQAEKCLSQLQTQLAVRFLSRVLDLGGMSLRAREIEPPPIPALATHDHRILYDLRRDLSGVSRTRPVRRRAPDPSHEAVAVFFLRLLAHGAVLEGAELRMGTSRVRVLHTPGRSMSSVRASFAEEAYLNLSADFVVCVGASEDGGVPTHVVRNEEEGTVVRPALAGRWVTADEGERALGM